MFDFFYSSRMLRLLYAEKSTGFVKTKPAGMRSHGWRSIPLMWNDISFLVDSQMTFVAADDKLPEIAGERFPLLGI